MFHGYFMTDFWWIFPLIFIILFIFMMSRGCMMGGHKPGGPAKTDSEESAMDILNKRYARGEIDKSEYEEKKSAINSPK